MPPKIAPRLAAHDGQNPRREQEKASRYSRTAGVTEDAGEAALEIAAVEEGVDDAVAQTPPAAVGPLEALLPLAPDLVVALIDQAVQALDRLPLE